MFLIIELVVLLGLIYTLLNILRYFFFRDEQLDNWLFYVSDQWIKQDKKRGDNKK